MRRPYSTVLAIGALCLFSCLRAMPALAVETTLYVGKHFEVRDHDQPTKYVINGDTRIARITGSLSTNTRIQRFRLHAGWNLLSLAVSATNLSEQLQRPGVVASAHSWNAQTGTYSPVPQVAPSGMVLWVNATTNTTLAVIGTYADPVNRQVAAGATYLAGTGLEAWTPTLSPSVAAWSFDAQPPGFNPQPTWHARLTGDLATINDLPNTFPPGHALYVINNAPFELEIPDPALRIRYYHQDHLGSSSVMTDASGVLVEETAFYPFGIPRHELRLRQVEEAYKFTQKERDRESGLHYFEARYLAGGMSRFLSVDPKYANTESSQGDPQALHLYAYVRNNPLQYTDPTGLERKPDPSKIAQGALAGATAADKAAEDQSSFSTILNNVATFTIGFCDNAYGCGMGGYEYGRSILVTGAKVDTDSRLFNVAGWLGFGTSLALPVPIVGATMKTLGTGEKVAVKAAEKGGTTAAKSAIKREATTVATSETAASRAAARSMSAAEIEASNKSIAAGQARMKANALAREQAWAHWGTLSTKERLATLRQEGGKWVWGPLFPK